MQIQIHISPKSPDELASYLAALQAFQGAFSAFQPAPSVTIAERGDPPVKSPPRGEERELRDLYRSTQGQIFRLCGGEMDPLAILREWRKAYDAIPKAKDERGEDIPVKLWRAGIESEGDQSTKADPLSAIPVGDPPKDDGDGFL